MSRIRIFALFAVLAALTVALAACGGGSDRSSEDPQKVIDSATLKGIESGKLDLQLAIRSTGAEGGDLTVSLSGPFKAGATKEDLPELALSAKADGKVRSKPVDFEGNLTLLSNRAFVGFNGKEYEVDPTTFGFVKSAIEQAEQKGGKESADVTACQQAAAGLDVADFVDNLKNEGGAEVEGAETTKISGELNSAGAVDALIKLTEDPACSAQLEAAGPLPLSELRKAKAELGSVIREAHVDVYVGEDDIVRKVDGDLTVEPKGSSEKVEVSGSLTLGEVNEEQEIQAPANAQPLEGLFQELGVNPLELLQGFQNGNITGLLKGLSGGGSGILGLGGGSNQIGPSKATLECYEHVKTSADLQQCATEAS